MIHTKRDAGWQNYIWQMDEWITKSLATFIDGYKHWCMEVMYTRITMPVLMSLWALSAYIGDMYLTFATIF